jgi:hypothetical protein
VQLRSTGVATLTLNASSPTWAAVTFTLTAIADSGGQGGGALLDAGHGFSTVSLNSLGGASLDSTARARSLSSHESLGGDSGLLLLHHHSNHQQQQQQVVARQHSVDALDDVGGGVKQEKVGGISTDTVERNARIFRWLCNVKPADSKDQVT